MDYNGLLDEYNLRFKNSQDVVASFLLDIDSKKYVKHIKESGIDEKELIKILQSAILPFSNGMVKSLIIETNDWNIVFLKVLEEESDLLYVVVAKRKMALGALLSIMKSN